MHNISPYNNGGNSLTNPRFYFFPVENMSITDIQNNLAQLKGIVTAEVLMILWTPLHLKKQQRPYTTRNPKLLIEYLSLLASGKFPDRKRYTEQRTELYTKTYNNRDYRLLEAYEISPDYVLTHYGGDFRKHYSCIYHTKV